MTFRRFAPVAIVVALAFVAVASADLKRPHQGVYTGDNGTVQARVWVDIVHNRPFRAAVVPQGPSALESGDPNTTWVAPTTCSDGTSQPFSLSPSKDLKINNRTGGFHEVVDTDEPLGTDGNIL